MEGFLQVTQKKGNEDINGQAVILSALLITHRIMRWLCTCMYLSQKTDLLNFIDYLP